MYLGFRVYAASAAVFLFIGTQAQGEEITGPAAPNASDARKEFMNSSKYDRVCKRSRPRNNSAGDSADATPKALCLIPPVYPQECFIGGHRKDVVSFLFDITPDGYVENVSLVKTTYECVVQAAANSVYLNRYEESEMGAKDVPIDVTFELSS